MLGVFSQSGVSKCWVCFHKVECLNVGCGPHYCILLYLYG